MQFQGNNQKNFGFFIQMSTVFSSGPHDLVLMDFHYR